ncbi:MAG: site-2 protease family protein [Micromonosporaceae bacterium]
MRPTFRLGRFAGVDIGVHWSVLIIFVLIASGLSAGRFPVAYPGHPAWAYLLAGLAAAVVFFLGLLAHELSHAVMARRNGLSVEGITLWMFGGVARLSGEARSPRAELRIAGIGPLVSLLIGLGFAAVATGLGIAGQTGLLFGAFTWLAGINVLLAVFNMIPAAPLDGGRLLRAGLWKLRGDRTWAAVIAARAGRVFGGALILFGVWLFFAAGGLGGLWLAMIGWFLFTAAGMEERQARLGGALHGVRVSQVMSREPQTVQPDVTVAEFIDRYLLEFRHSAFPLTEDGRPVGLVTLDRIKQTAPERRAEVALRDIACPEGELALAAPDEELTELLPRLSRCADGRALVVAGDKLVGIVSPSDISRAVQHASLRHEAPGRTALP